MNAYLMGYMGKEASGSWWERVKGAVSPAETRNPTDFLEGHPGYTLSSSPKKIPGSGGALEVGTYNPWANAVDFWGKELAERNLPKANAFRQNNPGNFPEYVRRDGTMQPIVLDQDIRVGLSPGVADAGMGAGFYATSELNGNYIGMGKERRHPGTRGNLSDRSMRFGGFDHNSPYIRARWGKDVPDDQWGKSVWDTLFHESVHAATMPTHQDIDQDKVSGMETSANHQWSNTDWKSGDRHITYPHLPYEASPPAAAFNRAAHTIGLEFPGTMLEAKRNVEAMLEYMEENPGHKLDQETRRFMNYWKNGDDKTRERLLQALPGTFADTGNRYQQGYASHA